TPLQRAPLAKLTRQQLNLETRSLTEFELLPADEERDRFRRMNYWKYRAMVRRARIDPRDPDAEAVREVETLLKNAQELRDGLVQGNMRLVVSIAKEFADANNTLDELISEGAVTLMKAVDKFDYSRGYRFSTYATYAIRRNLYRFVVNRGKE